MAEQRGCRFPEDRLYDVSNHLWYQLQADGTVRIGMTAVAVALSGEIVAFTPKRLGRHVDANRSCATIESGKWVGPARSRCGGDVVAVNDDLIARPNLANQDPYGTGWMVVLKPDDWSAVAPTLTVGDAVGAAYQAWMIAENFPGCGAAP